MYKNQMQPIYIQAAVAAAMIFFGVTVLDSILMSGIIVVFALLLLKDAYEMYKAEYVIAKSGLQYKVGDTVKWEIPWNSLDMVTRTKKNPRWVAVSDGQEFKMLKHTIENFESLINEVVKHGAVNKEMKVHESINQYMDFELKLDDAGRVKKKSRERLMGKDESSDTNE